MNRFVAPRLKHKRIYKKKFRHLNDNNKTRKAFDLLNNNHLKEKRNLKTFQSSFEAKWKKPKGETQIHYAWIRTGMQLFAFTHGRMHARKPQKSFVLALTNFFKNFSNSPWKKSPKSAKKKKLKTFGCSSELESWFQLLKVMVLKTGRMAFTDSFWNLSAAITEIGQVGLSLYDSPSLSHSNSSFSVREA